MAFTDTKLSYFHSFSKMPAQNSTTLGNAINKSGHTVTASEVWAQDIPYYGKMGSIEDVKSKVQPYARKNDMCYITAGADKGKTFQYDGNGNWTDITATLIDGALIKNANDDVVLLYHKGQTLTNLTADNNANTDSANNAARLWAKRDTEGVTIANNGTRLIEQFAAPTDKALNGLASVAYAPVIANGTLVSGADYYDYCFSGTILWASARTASTLIDCFEYVGQKVSTVVDTVSAQGTTLQNVKDQVDTISEALGLGPTTPGQDTLGSRVSKTESALRTMLGLGTDAEVVASQSISKSIQDAIDALGDVAVKSDIKISEIKVKVGSGEATPLTPDGDKSVTVEIPEVQAAAVSGGVITTDGFAKASDAKAIAEKAIESAIADGSTIDTRIDEVITTAVADGGTIDNRIDTLISNATSTSAIVDNDTSSKLVTASQVATYVASEVGAIDVGVVSVIIDENEIPDGVKLGDDFQNRKLSIWTPPVQYAETHKGTNYLVTAEFASTLATNAGNAAVTTINGKSLASLDSSTQGSYVTVTTSGTIGDGLSVTVDDSALASTVSAASTAIQGITINDGNDDKLVNVGEGNIVNIRLPQNTVAGDNTTTHGFRFSTLESLMDVGGASGHYLHIAAAEYNANTKTWGDGTTNYFTTASTVESFVNATVGADLTALETKVNNFHKAGVSYVVADTLPTIASGTEATYNGKVYLVNTGLNGVVAADGSRIEYMYVNKGSEDSPSWDWEQIGTTKTDLSGYAKSVTINGQTYTATAVNAGALDLGTVVTSASESNHTTWDGTEGTHIISSPIYTHIASDGTLKQAILVADGSEYGVSKVFSGNYWELPSSVTATAVSTATASAMFNGIEEKLALKADTNNVVNSINGIQGAVNLCVHNYRGSDDSGEGSVATHTTNHSNLWGMTFTNNDVNRLILVDEFVGMSNAYLKTANLPSYAVSVENNFVYDADGQVITTIRPERMVSGFNAKSATGLKSFVGDLSNLENASFGSSWDDRTFYSSNALDTFIGDLSSLTNGECMFCHCYNLTTFISDLSSLTNGDNMFNQCKLDAESLECIADTINDVRPLTTANEVTKKIDIGYNCSAADAQAAYDTITGKGWTCVMEYND